MSRQEDCCFYQRVPSSFELERCCEFIRNGDFNRVALQLPSEYLKYAVDLVNVLKAKTDKILFILGDSPYHTCCVDEIQAQKLNCSCVIHFGNSCFSRETTFPTLYIYNELEVDCSMLVDSVRDGIESKDTPILLIYNTNCSQIAKNVYSALKVEFVNLECSQLLPENTKESVSHVLEVCFGRRFTLKFPRECYTIIFIGEENRTCLNFRLSFHSNKFYLLSPTSQSLTQLGSESKLLKKRYHLVQKVDTANIVGILIGNMWLRDYLSILSDIKSALRKKGKEYYTISMGNIQPTKLTNFLEVDIFVLLGCPENVILDSSDYYKPVITPYELYLALSDSPCSVITDNYSNDINSDFIKFSSLRVNDTDEDNLLDHTKDTQLKMKYDYALQKKEQPTASSFLEERTWRGLEKNTENLPSLVETGKAGIPIFYSSEKSQLSQPTLHTKEYSN